MDIGCGLGILVIDFQYLCIIMTQIDLRPEMVDRDFKRSVTVVVDRGEEDYIWIWGRPWGGGGFLCCLIFVVVVIDSPNLCHIP